MCPFTVALDFEGIFGRVVQWVLAMWRGTCCLLRISVCMCMGSIAWDGERCTDRFLIWTRIDCRKIDAQEFLLPSYFYFVWVLKVPCKDMFDCRVFRAWCVCCSFVDDVYLFIIKKFEASVVAEHSDWEECLVFEVRENVCMSCFDGEDVLRK